MSNNNVFNLQGEPEDEFTQLLRGALRAEAAEVVPNDRWDEVLDAVEKSELSRQPRRSNLRVLVAASVGLIALGMATTLVAPRLLDRSEPAATITAAPTTTTTTTTSGPPSLPTTLQDLVIYYVDANGLLHPEYRDLPSQGDRLTTAVAGVLNVAPNDPTFTSSWAGGQVNSAKVVGNRIVLDFSASAFSGFTDHKTATQAVNQVVYTATAAVGDRNGVKTVQILVDGSPNLPVLGAPLTDFTRDGLRPLAQVWLMRPNAGVTYPAGDINISGAVQEQPGAESVHWELKNKASGDIVGLGNVKSVPIGGGWRSWGLDVALPPGEYTVRISALGFRFSRSFNVR